MSSYYNEDPPVFAFVYYRSLSFGSLVTIYRYIPLDFSNLYTIDPHLLVAYLL